MSKDPEGLKEAHRGHIARELRRCFGEKKAAISGHTYKPTSRHDKIDFFRNAADICMDESVSPEQFIEACFQGCPMKTGPFPNQLSGAGARRWVAAWKQNGRLIREGVGDMAKNAGIEVDDTPDVTIPAEQELRDALVHAQHFVLQVTGKPDMRGPEAIECYINPHFTMHPVVRVLLGFPNPRVYDICGDQVQALLQRDPSWYRALVNQKFPVDILLQWLQQQTSLTQ